MSIAALVLGIISLIFGGWIGLTIGILSLIFAGVALKKQIGRRGFSIAGLVCGIIGTTYNLIYIILLLSGVIQGITYL